MLRSRQHRLSLDWRIPNPFRRQRHHLRRPHVAVAIAASWRSAPAGWVQSFGFFARLWSCSGSSLIGLFVVIKNTVLMGRLSR